MLLDVERKRKTEIEDTGGVIWHLAHENEVDVPYLDFGYRVVRAFDERIK
jgi:ketopantoate reductase